MRIFFNHLNAFIGSHPKNWMELVWLSADAASAFVLFMGLTTLAGYTLDKPFLYDGWFKNSVDMSPQTALSFALTGFALLTIHRNQEYKL